MSAAFQVSDVEEMIALMEQWGIAEVHVTVGDASLDLVRASYGVHGEGTPEVPAPVALREALAASAEEGVAEPVVVRAPVVGVFHLATRGFPGGVPVVGDQVQAGQIIGSIELMHIPTEMVAPIAGIIEGILVDEGAGVEYNQPLFLIRSFEEVSEDEAGMLPPPAR